jgi:hypothetical protein
VYKWLFIGSFFVITGLVIGQKWVRTALSDTFTLYRTTFIGRGQMSTIVRHRNGQTACAAFFPYIGSRDVHHVHRCPLNVHQNVDVGGTIVRLEI